ncbi:MAG: hypothetical protein B7Z55_02720 [Planctomycetales bacterium 12-60-4]|nr:MAG: hypothetical protein B7Z55_02720 [Planctomycetales bacterium 12-60-4]
MKSCLLLAALCLTTPLAYADDLLPPITTGQRVATCGHSFHVFTYKQVHEIAKAAGLDHQLVGLSSIGGSTVQKHWAVPEEKSAVKQVLKTGKVDVLTLSPIWLPDDAIEQFIKLGVEHNPALRITVQEYWMPNDEYNPVYPLDTKKKVDHNATDIAKLRDATTRYAKDIEEYVSGINQRLGKQSVFIVPVGMAAVTLREKILKGEAPGLKTQAELFRDNWGHAMAPLQILSSYCHFAVIYRRSPAGLPVPNAFKALKDMSDDDKARLNTLLQQIAWDTVTHHPMAGLMKPAAAK